MFILRAVALALTVGALAAQSGTLTTTFANNNGGAVGGVVYFDLQANGGDVTITDMDLNLNVAGVLGSIDIYTFPVTAFGNEALGVAGGWVLHSNDPVTAAGGGQLSNFVLSSPLTITAGTSIGVALVANGVQHAYTTGTAPFPLVYESCPLMLTAGTASNVPFTAGLFTPRVVNTSIHYTHTGACAKVESVGDGCSAQYESFYEFFSDPTQNDLNGLAFTYTPTGTGYIVAPGGSFLPVGSLTTPTALVLADDGEVSVPFTVGSFAGPDGTPWTSLNVISNGKISETIGNSTLAAPSTFDLLGAAISALYMQADFDPSAATGGGNVWVEETAGLTTVTWEAVPFWNHTGTSSNTFQFQLYPSGQVTVAIQQMSLIAGSNGGVMIGYSPGGQSSDPGNADLSTIGAIITNSPEILPLALEANGRPVDGAAPSSFDVTTSNIDPNGIIHVGIIGLSNPSLPLILAGFGPGDCTSYASLDIVTGVTLFPAGPVTWTALAMPGGGGVNNGFQFYVQAATMDAGILNGNGRASNGLFCTVGDI